MERGVKDMVRYQDIIEDVNRKLLLLERWYSVYKLAEHYDSYFEACYGSQARSFIQIMGILSEELVSTKHIIYDLPCMPGLADFLMLWNSFDLKGMYIYRATTVDYIKNYIESSTPFMVIDSPHIEENKYISFWSISPYTSHYFVNKYIQFNKLDANKIRVLVAPYDNTICSKDWYDNFSSEYTVIIDNKPYNFGKIIYLRELEVRCFKYPSSKVTYSLTVDDFNELMKYLPKKYTYFS
ncbi:MAG: hypothetical protein L7G90_03235 [Candidatus Nanopusillus sp.]|jgi:hypothetical protein|nr:hypothetical protein [Candidatus Nanopusillus sp.]